MNPPIDLLVSEDTFSSLFTSAVFGDGDSVLVISSSGPAWEKPGETKLSNLTLSSKPQAFKLDLTPRFSKNFIPSMESHSFNQIPLQDLY